MNSPYLEEQLSHQWVTWIRIQAKQRLLLACNMLMTKTVLYLTHHNNLSRLSWQDLRMPVSTALWDASDSSEWRTLLLHEPQISTVQDTLGSLHAVQYYPFDHFQSGVLIAGYATIRLANPTPPQIITYAISHAPASQLHLHAALLATMVPMRPLLAVAGESWTPAGGRLATHARTAAVELGHMKVSLRNWVNQAFAPSSTGNPSSRRGSLVQDPLADDNPVHRAVHCALTIVRLAVQLEGEGRTLPFAGEMPLFAASLVLWAVGFEAQRRGINPGYTNMTPPPSGTASSDAKQAVLMFLSSTDTGLKERLWSGDVNATLQWRHGVESIMRWARTRIGGTLGVTTTSGGTMAESAAAAAARPRSQSLPQLQSASPVQANFPQAQSQAQWGELAAGAVNVLRRVESRGWAGLWF